jgi:pimeloyl-ACP methyl ester carboxylesterase
VLDVQRRVLGPEHPSTLATTGNLANSLGDQGKQWPIAEDGTDTQILHTQSFKRGLGHFHFFSWEESRELRANGKEFPFILASPQCPPGQVWNSTTLLALIDELQASLPVDARRVYVTGLSMGGYGTWELAVKHPERFAAVAPICGGGERIRTLLPAQREALKTLGVWAFHGGKDNVVVPAETERMVEAFKKAGNESVKHTVYPEAGHDSWTQAYNDPALFEWMLQQSR